jgi:pimeloyl-ACP methyl ester carboxylesterase
MPRIKVGDITLQYDEQGDGEPLLLIMGYGGSSANLLPEYLAALARTFRVITFDNRGTGQSDSFDGPTSIVEMAGDAAGLLDELGIGRAHVMGVSMGGYIAQELALHYPDKVAGLVLGCTTCGPPVRVAPAPEVLAMIAPDAGVGLEPREAARRAWGAQYTPEFVTANRDFLESVLDRVLAHPTPVATRARQMDAIQAWKGSHDRLHELTAPTLIITGEHDVLIVPENARILHERIAGSRLHVVKDAAHNFWHSHPEETVHVVTEFLSSCSVGRQR